MKKLLPVIMMLVGTGAGVGAGVYLRPADMPAEKHAEHAEAKPAAKKTEADDHDAKGKEYVKLSNQFVVPIVERDRISSMVVMTLSVEAPEGQGQTVFDIEPKIRDVFLRVLFDHAAVGGFRGDFLNNDNLDVIRSSLRDAARQDIGNELISDVLIFEIARQDY